MINFIENVTGIEYNNIENAYFKISVLFNTELTILENSIQVMMMFNIERASYLEEYKSNIEDEKDCINEQILTLPVVYRFARSLKALKEFNYDVADEIREYYIHNIF